MRFGGALVAALCAAAGCGGGSTPAAAVLPPAPDAATPAVDAGTPAVDGGLPADSGVTPADAGTDAGPPDVGPDAGSDGGAPGCAGLLPADAGTPIVVNLDLGDPSEICAAAQPDEGGTVPLRISTYDDNGLRHAAWPFYRAADGVLLSRQEFADGTGPDALFSQPQGFIGVAARDVGSGQPHVVVRGFARDGTPGASTDIPGRAAFATEPEGGLALVNWFLTPHATVEVTYWHFDQTGHPLEIGKPVGIDDPTGRTDPWAIVGVSVNDGHALVVWGWTASPCFAIWVNREGGAIGSGFQPPTCRVHRLLPLLDGAMAVETYNLDAVNTITAVVPDGSQAWTAAPAWLAGRSLREFVLLPNGRGYALRQSGAQAPLEIVEPSGTSCGAVATPELGKGPLQIGRDGTLVEQDSDGASCTFRWYPQLFK